MLTLGHKGMYIGVVTGIFLLIVNIYVVNSGCFNCGLFSVDSCRSIDNQCDLVQDSQFVAIAHLPYILTSIIVSLFPFSYSTTESMHFARLLVFALITIPLLGLVGHLIQKIFNKIVTSVK